MHKTMTIDPASIEQPYDLVEVIDEEDQDWLPLGEPEEPALEAASSMLTHPDELPIKP